MEENYLFHFCTMKLIGYLFICTFAIARGNINETTVSPGHLVDYARSDDSSSYTIDKTTCRFEYESKWYPAIKYCQNSNRQLLCFKSQKEVDEIVDYLSVIGSSHSQSELWFYNRNCSTNKPESDLSVTITKSEDGFSYSFSTDYYLLAKKRFICCSNAFGPCTDACKNDGTCFMKQKKPVCKCRDGYSGEYCEITPCDSYPCENGGTCTSQLDRARCSCVHPYSGNHCEYDPCTFHGCHYGGTCSFEGETAVCDCVQPYSGENCETDPCTNYTCLNKGYCNFENKGFTPKCQCYRPYFGERCEKEPCMDNPCKNGGTCKVELYEAKCECPKPYMGEFCETDSRYVGIMSLLGVLIVMVLLLLICGCCCMNKIIETLRLTLHNSGVYRQQNLGP